MQEPGLTIILSGHVRRPQSADLRPFWRGFIELQSKLPSCAEVKGFLVHSWNPELSALIDLVYSPRASQYEGQACFYPEFIQNIEPPDLFEKGLDRFKSTWKNISVQTVLGNARSRARAVALMDSLPLEEANGRVLIARWDLGQTGSSQVNRLVADASLPENYMYMSYFSGVDEGYADMWIVAPWQLARRFRVLDTFVLDCLAGRNLYLELFTRAGWLRSRNMTRLENMLLHPIGQRIRSLVLKSIQCMQHKSDSYAFMQRVVRKLLSRPKHFLELPPITAENSCVPGNTRNERIFPDYLALNIHALLKFFILSEGLREQTRFLTHEDFELSSQSGQLIQPQPSLLFLWADGKANCQTLWRLMDESPLPIAAVYLMSKTQVLEATLDDHGEVVLNTLNPVSEAALDQLICALDAAAGRPWGCLPLMILPSAAQYLACTDWFYLNALLKYIAWSGIGYVGMDNEQGGKQYLEFPDMELVRGKGAFSLRKAAGTLSGIRPFLDRAGASLEELISRAECMALEFPCIVPGRSLF